MQKNHHHRKIVSKRVHCLSVTLSDKARVALSVECKWIAAYLVCFKLLTFLKALTVKKKLFVQNERTAKARGGNINLKLDLLQLTAKNNRKATIHKMSRELWNFFVVRVPDMLGNLNIN